jgi:ABC-2 type transport system permease protein
MTGNAPARTSVTLESLLFASRLFTRWRRHPTVPIQALLFPTFLLITYHLLVSKSMMRLTGADSLYSLVPMCAVAGGMLGALGASLTLPGERNSGLLSRMWTFPVHRASALIGRLLAEAARTFVSTVLITAVGVGLGLRFKGNWLAMVAFLLVPVLVVAVFSTLVITVALRSEGSSTFAWLGSMSIGLVFCSAAPPEIFPRWLRPVIQLQPMKPTVESMRALAHGDPALWPLLVTFAWTIGMAAVFVPLAMRSYRTAAESGV